MHPPILPPPPSSSASARVIVLRPRRSRLAIAWWLALHALLLGAAALVGVPVWLRALAALAVVAHGVLRWPRAPPAPILLAEDGACRVPALGTEWLAPGPRTLLAAWWVRLSLASPAGTRDILLWVDQLDAAAWARLNARLRRRPATGTAAVGGVQRTGQADLR